MHKYWLILFALALISCNSGNYIQKSGKYKLVWQDEFIYTGLPDSTK